jgi:hypothetical protein
LLYFSNRDKGAGYTLSVPESFMLGRAAPSAEQGMPYRRFLGFVVDFPEWAIRKGIIRHFVRPGIGLTGDRAHALVKYL